MQHELKKFLSVVEHKSFTRAAEVLHVSQPALSMAIQNLEKELGTELIVRDGRNLQLTQHGQVVYESAQRIRQEIEIMNALIAAADRHERVRIGMIDSLAARLVGNTAWTASPGTTVSVHNSGRLIRDVAYERLDLACVTATTEPLTPHVRSERLGQERLILVTSPTHAPVVSRQIAAGRLDQWLSYNQESYTYQIVRDYLEKHSIHAEPVFFSTSPDVLRLQAAQGRGAAFLPEHSVRQDIQQRRLKRVRLPQLHRPIWAIWHKRHHLSNQSQTIIASLKASL
jgi:LysR family cyn operon transcriptional activator